MPGKREDREAPRTDLPPRREPYDEGYFGTEEEEGIVREREASEGERSSERRRDVAEDAAGGDREI
jgi:hypothetical protein